MCVFGEKLEIALWTHEKEKCERIQEKSLLSLITLLFRKIQELTLSSPKWIYVNCAPLFIRNDFSLFRKKWNAEIVYPSDFGPFFKENTTRQRKKMREKIENGDGLIAQKLWCHWDSNWSYFNRCQLSFAHLLIGKKKPPLTTFKYNIDFPRVCYVNRKNVIMSFNSNCLNARHASLDQLLQDS